MRIAFRLAVIGAVFLLASAAAFAQDVARPRSYADVIENDYPTIQLRFGKGAPASLVAGQNRVGLLSGAGFTTEGVDLFGDYTIEWWQMVPNLDRRYPVARIGGRDIGVEPLPKKKENDPPSGVFSTGDADVRSTTIVYPGKWYHVAMVVQGRTTQWFVNGFPDGKVIERGTKPSGELRLGTDIPGNAKMADGEVAVYGYAVPPQRIKMHFQSALDSHAKRKPVTVGHRGNNEFAPENTRISYVQAVEAGTPILEFDTALTKDGHIVGLHDKTLDRTTDGAGPVAEMTLEQVRKFEAGSWKDPKYKGEPIPTLDEVADVARGKAVLMLDFKAEGQGPAIAAWLDKSKYPRDQVMLAPWTDEEGSALRQHVKDVPMIRLTSKVPAEKFDKAYFDRMKQIGFSGFSVNWQHLSQAFTDAAHRNGMAVYVWTINDNPEIAGATLLGADGIITDDPASTMKTVATLTGKQFSPMSTVPTAATVAPPSPLEYAQPTEIKRAYRYWRMRILTTAIVGYALYYFVRANDSVPVTAMQADLGFTKAQLGLISSIGGVTYGVSKFVNGFLGDHANPRWFMSFGLLVCAIMNFCFGFSSTLPFLAGYWMMNMFAQGMGFPPCAKSMAHWYAPSERNSTFGYWHISHMLGGAAIHALTGYLVVWYGWRSCFHIPAALALVGVVIIILFMRDTPESMGLPPVETYKGEESPREVAEEIKAGESYWTVVRDYILLNPFMWVVSMANFLVYMLRWIQMKWGPTFLQQAKGLSVVKSAWLSSGSEMAGLVSALLAGIIADKVFRGRAGRVCVIAMACMTIAIYAFWKAPKGDEKTATALFITMGFFLYIPQMLIAAMAMSLGTKRASAAAVGMTGLFGYLSTIPAGWGVGWMADHYGWNGPFALMFGCAIGTMVLMLVTWNVGAHPQKH